MPVIKLINEHQSSFDPEAIKIIVSVYDKACTALGLVGRTDPMAELLAKKVIEAAQTGERDPLRIFQMAIDSLGAAMPHYPGWPADSDEDSKSSH
jgi:hypothetical protein